MAGGPFSEKTTTKTRGSSRNIFDVPSKRTFRLGARMLGRAARNRREWTETVEPQSQTTLDTIQALIDRAAGSPLEAAAQAEAQRTLEGEYLGSNPYLDQMAEAAGRQAREAHLRGVMPGLEARFAGSGRIGSPGYASAVARANQDFSRELTDTMANLYGSSYESERNRMLAMEQMAPALAGMDYRNIKALGAAGEMEDMYERRLLAQERERENWRENDRIQRALLAAGITPLQLGSEWEQKTQTIADKSLFDQIRMGASYTASNLMGGAGMMMGGGGGGGGGGGLLGMFLGGMGGGGA